VAPNGPAGAEATGGKAESFQLRNFSGGNAVDTCVEGISERDICTSDLDSLSATEILEILSG